MRISKIPGPQPSPLRKGCELILTPEQQARIAELTSADIFGLDREPTLEEWKSLALKLVDLRMRATFKPDEEFRRNVKHKRSPGRPLLWTSKVLSAVRKTIDEIKHNSVEVEARRRELEFVRECDGTEALIIEYEDRLRSLQKPLKDIAAAERFIDRWAETNSLRMRGADRKSYAQSICVALSKAKGK